MKLNETKTKVMIFNIASSVDILPELKINNENILEVVEEMKLLGIVIQSNLKWKSNTSNLTKKGWRRMWLLRNLNKLGGSEEQLLKVYIEQIRSVLEMACPVWHPGLTEIETRNIERLQKTAFAIIRGQDHTNYRDALEHFNLNSLKQRREDLCLNFAKKALKSEKFKNWFCRNEQNVETRRAKMHLKEVYTRTRRYEKSPLPNLTKLLNSHLHNDNLSERSLELWRPLG